MTRSVAVSREGVVIDGRPIFLLSGCVHYFRWPRAEWRPLLEQARWAGLNTIDTVIPWNFHAPRPGEHNFRGDADLGAFLDLCAELGLYAIVRPGPYICAEWENGGLPAWLTAGGDLRLRTDDPAYMGEVGRWFDALMPVLAPRQITCGGPIILCQIENEHWASGVYASDDHQASLAAAAIVRGIDVPQYTCMGAMNGWAEFRNGWSGIAEKLTATRARWPENPMIVSELWSGWFDNWGGSLQTRKSPAKLDITLHQLTAVGASGFSHWMWAGGTNFGYWGGRTVGGDTIHMTTSYGYDAPISEYGELTPKALVARRHHLFLQCFGAALAPVLADAVPGGLTVLAPAAVRGRSEGGAAPYRTVRAGPSAPPAWRDFCCTYLHNPGLEGATYQIFLPGGGPHLSVEVEPTSMRPIFANMPLGETGAQIAYHSGRILGFWPALDNSDGPWDEREDGLVIYGQLGEQGLLGLRLPRQELEVELDDNDSPIRVSVEGDTLHVRYWITEGGSHMYVRAGGRDLTVRLLSQERAEQLGPLTEAGPLAPASRLSTSQIALPTERLPVLEASDPDGWQEITAPTAMERLGCDYGYGWYRAELDLEAPLEATLMAPELADRARVLLNGADIGWLGVGMEGPRYTLPLKLAAGRHELRILADNLGRFNYGVKLGERKGLLDTLYLGGAQEDISGGWVALWQEVQFAGEAVANVKPWAVRPDASDVHLGRFAFAGPSVWLLRTVQAEPGRRYLIHMTGDRNSGGFFVNGAAVERFSRHRSGGVLRADITDLLHPGTNVLALNILEYAGAPWRATLAHYDPTQPLPARWSFRPGVTLGDRGQGTGDRGPAFYRARFSRTQLPTPAPRLRLRVGGLVKGQIWLNGYNVGRYWQVGPQEDYKLPLSWLADENELLIFAEEGETAEVTLLA
ncbi:beta-galactosidase [Oscillochloris sp. ZM17-4]|uniref:glycoside hydrolase family 35 protein n=1 Tax=Oscillochloris sp. ZM17-4 TaxID=2866714 RepID=UPI001C735448|nr:beta-galactosidase [Oscillochloris sp. ZM17-4]MBX0329515.1 beta-galactosidase [Oscillochloris sp. ZM17-4]